MLVPLSILFGALLTAVTAIAIGRTVLRSVELKLYRWEEDALAFVTGAAALSGIVFVACVVHLARPGVFLAIAAAAVGIAMWRGAHRSIRPAFEPLPRFWKWLFFAGFTVFTVLYFFSAMAPEFSADGVSYHLSFVAKYARARGFVHLPTNIYAQLSQGIELLYLMAFMFGKHSAASLVHYAFLLSLTLAVVSYGRRTGHPIPGLMAGLFVYVSPVVGMDATCGYIDVAVASILFAVFYMVQLWDEQRSTGLAATIGFVAGFGYAAKYTAFLAIPYAAGFALWRSRKVKPALVIIASSLVLAAPWVIKNIIWAANPVAPMFNSVFPNPFVHLTFERGWTEYLRHYDLPSRLAIPLEVTMRGEKLCGFLGPLFLLAPLCIFGLRTREGRRALAAGVLFALPYVANIGTRFLIPPLPFFAWTLALVLIDLRWVLATAAVLHCLLSWPSLAHSYTAAHPWMLGRIPFRQALRLESEDRWLTRSQSEYPIAKLFDSAVPKGQRILSMTGVPESYTSREVWVRFQSASSETLGDMFYGAFNGDFQPKCGEQLKWAPRNVRKLRIVQTAHREWVLEWSISELRLFSNGAELPRRDQWRLTAKPNPWDIQLAFDNNPVTRWRSWQPFDSGMRVEVDLGQTQAVDGVLLSGPTDCSEHDLRVEGMGPDGNWTMLADKREILKLTPPLFMGKAAMQELKLRGADYLFIRDTDFGNAEVLENPEAWGLTEVGRASNGRLFRNDAGYPQFQDKADDKIVSRR